MNWTSNRRIALIAVVVFILDQLTKLLVLKFLGPTQERIMIDGFFKFVHWDNTGAAWSLLRNKNGFLALVSLGALVGLFLWRKHFYVDSIGGQISLGLIFGGIIGNLWDRIAHQHVVDFLRFYLLRRSGEEIGFPAFNIADTAICTGVGLLILLSWKKDATPVKPKVPDERSAEA